MPVKDDDYYESLGDDSDDWTGPSMYSTEGDAAVRAAVAQIERMVSGTSTIRNKKTLTEAAQPILQAVAKVHPEIYDTEPRAWISNRLDAICEANSWAYDPYDGYYW